MVDKTLLLVHEVILKAERIRLDCVRNEPQSEPFVGQARSYIENSFLRLRWWVCQFGRGKILVLGKGFLLLVFIMLHSTLRTINVFFWAQVSIADKIGF